MGGIHIIPDKRTKATQAVKLAAELASYMFEQQYGELEKYANPTNIKALKNAQKALNIIIARSTK